MNKLRSFLYTTARILGDIQAVRKGRIGKRIYNKIIGRISGKFFK